MAASETFCWNKPLKCKSLTVKGKTKSYIELMLMKYMYVNLRGRGRFYFGL